MGRTSLVDCEENVALQLMIARVKMTQEEIDRLRDRMRNHIVENDMAIVKVTADELQRLLDIAERQLNAP